MTDGDGQLMESRRQFTRAGLLDEVAVEFPGEVEPVHGEVEAVVAVAVVLPPHVFHLDEKPLVPHLTQIDFLSHGFLLYSPATKICRSCVRAFVEDVV